MTVNDDVIRNRSILAAAIWNYGEFMSESGNLRCLRCPPVQTIPFALINSGIEKMGGVFESSLSDRRCAGSQVNAA
jgi:hypothetical protein